MNKFLFNYVLILSLVALSSSLYSAQGADIPNKQVVLHPRIVRYLNMLSPLAPYTRDWLHSKEAFDYRIYYGSGYHKPYLVDLAGGDGRFQEMAEFLAAGADVNAADSRGNTAIAYSLYKPLQLKLLLDYKAEVNVPVDRTGDVSQRRTLLSACCLGTKAMGHFNEDQYRESLGILLADPRIDVNRQDADGTTPLRVMAAVGIEKDMPYIQCLIECGANPMIKNSEGEDVLDVLMKRSVESQQASLCKAVLKLFDEQRKAEGTWPKAGILPTIKECTVLSPDPASIVAKYAAPPAFVSDPDYHKKLDAAIEAVAKCSAAS